MRIYIQVSVPDYASISKQVSVFPHLGRDSLLACTTVKSKKVSDVSPSTLKKNRLYHLRNRLPWQGSVDHGLARIFFFKNQD